MNLREFIETKYDVKDKIANLKSNPILDFINSDIFPFDFIEYNKGEMVKMIYYANGKKEIPVLELLSNKREDIVKSGDNDLLEAYDMYTSQFDLEQVDLLDPVKLEQIREESLKNKGNHYA